MRGPERVVSLERQGQKSLLLRVKSQVGREEIEVGGVNHISESMVMDESRNRKAVCGALEGEGVGLSEV